jgi:hypothetical protein
MDGRHVTFAKQFEIIDNIENSDLTQDALDSEQKYPDEPESASPQKVSERPGTPYPIGSPKPAAERQLSDKEKLAAAAAAYIQKRLAFLSDPAAQRRHGKKQEAKAIKAQKKEAHRIKHLRPGY